jgi:hypothetical protein
VVQHLVPTGGNFSIDLNHGRLSRQAVFRVTVSVVGGYVRSLGTAHPVVALHAQWFEPRQMMW